jgi:hypothetical protein
VKIVSSYDNRHEIEVTPDPSLDAGKLLWIEAANDDDALALALQREDVALLRDALTRWLNGEQP